MTLFIESETFIGQTFRKATSSPISMTLTYVIEGGEGDP